MRKLTIFCAMTFFLALTITPVAAQAAHHGGMDDGKGKSPHGMMMQHKGSCMEMMGGQMCPMCGMKMGGGGMGMMHGSMHGEMRGMMMGGMAPSFYLGMQDKLGLEKDQVQQLRDIRRDFRKNSIRQSAELKIGKLEMEELFQGDWTVEKAEEQLQKVQQLRTDLIVKYLKARKKAEQVLTSEQLQQVQEMDRGGSMR
ncbi:MAG TPA: hypothetical protein VJ882_03115 [Desulfuromonadales bacterium]|nr:hypothetical protein [Desulfuromonadales bacterium]